MITKKVCNSIKNDPLPDNTAKLSPDKIVGYNLFPEIYSNIMVVARKRSGKTSTIFNVIKHCADKDTNVIVFCSTCENDVAWITIREYLEKAKIPYEFFKSIMDNGTNNLLNIIEEMKIADEEEEEEEPEPEIILLNHTNISVRVKKKKKKKKVSPKYIVIFDDMSAELKNPAVSQLLKQNRHYKSKVLISSQYLLDILPEARNQIQYYLIFGGINEQKLFEIYRNANLNLTFEQFMSMYKDATSKPYSFFYVSTYCNYRQNFNIEYDVPK
eukprot:Lithocolla_globosa_v1_NODE_1547_length_2493_cov_371.285773.p1 type:complete len:271 gc:universal NODE_1547_length_2493_cov_371.285773:1275-463(-)